MSDPSRVRLRWHRSSVRALTTMVITATSAILLCAVVYLLSGEVHRVDDALFEATAGLTTTSLGVLNPEELSSWLLIWRATTQWIGGAGTLLFALLVVPTFGGHRRLSQTAKGRGQRAMLFGQQSRMATRVILIYTGFTGAVMMAYGLAGMGITDAVTFGLTTSSTGGFANYQDSFTHFDSATIEWIAASAMCLAGTSLATLMWLIRGQVQILWRSSEIKLYGLLVLVSTMLLTIWTWQDTGGGLQTLRRAFFIATSSLSTTGFRVADWSGWDFAPQVLLLMLIGVGAMAGSAGGGFKVVRVIEILGIVRRELVVQLHPQAVVPVKVSGASVAEDSLTRVQNFQILWVLAAAVGVFGVTAFGEDLLTAVSGALSALATAGPGLGELAGFADATVLAAPARAVLMVLMFLGWLAIYPVVVVLGWGIGELQRLRLR
ncbi:MAG: TrkH family potassium uptake protein [Acidimicrobiia bacterium]|nr:TrkH family potassium uptake protein [Acidimicrobiia bacterium]